jgi:hypothetical protein
MRHDVAVGEQAHRAPARGAMLIDHDQATDVAFSHHPGRLEQFFMTPDGHDVPLT